MATSAAEDDALDHADAWPIGSKLPLSRLETGGDGARGSLAGEPCSKKNRRWMKSAMNGCRAVDLARSGRGLADQWSG